MKLLVLALLVVCVPLAYGRIKPPKQEISYLAYMPNRIKPGSRFNIWFLFVGLNHPITVTVICDGMTVTTTVYPGTHTTITFFKARQPKNRYSYKLTMKGTYKKKTLFYQTRFISKDWGSGYRVKLAEIFLQKDKPMYKPNDLLRFRCFGLDRHLNVLRNSMNIKILDGKRNLVQAWYNQTDKTGVISKRFQISDQPVLGMWRLIIEQFYKGKLYRKTDMFRVKEFVLPPIKVELSGDDYIYHLGLPAFYLAERYIDLIITARYSFGAAVKGRVVLQITIMSPGKMSIQRILPIYGVRRYRFFLKEFMKGICKVNVNSYAGMPSYIVLKVTAKVIEKETQLVTLSAPKYINLRNSPIKINTISRIHIKPGLCNKLPVDIVREDGKNLKWSDIKNKLVVKFSGGGKTVTITICIPLDGKILIDIPEGQYTLITINYIGFYQKCEYTLIRRVSIRRFMSYAAKFVQAKLRKTIVYAGDDISVRIQSTAMLVKVFYTILKDNKFLGHGQVVSYGYFIHVNIKSSKAWLPGIKILFTCITITNEILVDVLSIKLVADFKYQVNGMFSPPRNQAGKFTTLQMSSQPASTVFILSVDERVEYLNKPYYITSNEIINALLGINNIQPVPGYISNAASLLNWCRLAWFSNKITYLRGPIIPFPGPGRPMPTLPMFENIARPMALMRRPVAMAKAPSTPSSPSVEVRDDFQTVWIWAKRFVGKSGFTTLKRKTPDSITKWRTTAFAVHKMMGVSVMEKPISFLSIQDMFLVLELPYSVLRMEVFYIDVIVFNYLPTTERVLVVVVDRRLIAKGSNSKIFTVGPRNYKKARFAIRPKVAGITEITVKLSRQIKRKFKHVDIIVKKLRVKPEGRTLYFNKELTLNMRGGRRIVKNINIKIPNKIVVPGSIIICVTLTGDLMGPVISNLGALVILPSGCGEQTAIYFVPNVYIFIYLKSRGALTVALNIKITKFTASGYQNQLKYQRFDGSFSAFTSDKKGSTWLTAFIAHSFQIVIDSGMSVTIDIIKLRKALNWILNHQLVGGNYVEIGRVIHKNMQGGAAKGHALTAYVMQAIKILKKYNKVKAEKALKRGLMYMSKLKLKTLDTYTLCIFLSTYATLKEKSKYNKVWIILKQRAKKTKDMMYWEGTYAVEQTGYVLNALACMKNINIGSKVLRWILTKRNSKGGFSNTQNTVVCLGAITKFNLLFTQNSNALVNIRSGKFRYTFKRITNKNRFVLQTKQIPSTIRRLTAIGVGRGRVFMQVYWQYNVLLQYQDNFGLLTSITTQYHSYYYFCIRICLVWTLRRKAEMIVVSATLPSGYAARDIGCVSAKCSNYKKCKTNRRCISQVENKGDLINVYMKPLPFKFKVYILIIAKQTFRVENKVTKMPVELISYYSGKAMRVFYKFKKPRP